MSFQVLYPDDDHYLRGLNTQKDQVSPLCPLYISNYLGVVVSEHALCHMRGIYIFCLVENLWSHLPKRPCPCTFLRFCHQRPVDREQNQEVNSLGCTLWDTGSSCHRLLPGPETLLKPHHPFRFFTHFVSLIETLNH